MSLREIGEFGFINQISKGCLIRPQRVVKAIGDDAAAFRTPVDNIGLVTTDLLVERIHLVEAFLLRAPSPGAKGCFPIDFSVYCF